MIDKITKRIHNNKNKKIKIMDLLKNQQIILITAVIVIRNLHNQIIIKILIKIKQIKKK
jgi:hypothetical protein